MRILIACEESGAVRRSFRERGHDAWSCDLVPARDHSEHHIHGDALEALDQGWDMMIAFPPCTHLCVSGARWFRSKQKEQAEGANFFMQLASANITRIAIENPIGVMSTRYRKPNQILQPWMFGHGETKAICLWLKNLPKLVPTNIVNGREARIHKMAPSETRSRDRSETYSGIAQAMAEQWGSL